MLCWLLALALVVCAGAQSPAPRTRDQKLSDGLIASQFVLAGAASAHVAGASTHRTGSIKGRTASDVSLVGTVIVLETVLLRKAGWKWKVAAIAGNVGASIVLGSLARNNVERSRRLLRGR